MARLTSLPAVGDGVTLHGWSDSHAYTVIEICSNRRIKIQQDNATRTNRHDDVFTPGGFVGHTESPKGQQWSYEADPQGRIVTLTLRKDGTWRESYTQSAKPASEGRSEHYDYNF